MMLIGVVLVVAIAIAEMVLAAAWNPIYCAVGLPLFARRIERLQGLADLSVEELTRGSATVAVQGFVFRRLGPDKIAFHEQGFGLMHYTPVMRGLIQREGAEAAIVVVGLLNWFVVALVTVLLVGLGRSFVIVAPWVGGFFAICYFIQAVRFWRVANAIRKQLD